MTSLSVMPVDEKEFTIGELTKVEEMAWSCDVLRVADGAVMRTVTLTPDTLPPRMKGKKVAWALPTDGSTPKLGMFEVGRVIALFRDLRKRDKKEKKKKDDEAAAIQKQKCKAPDAPVIVRYSKDELLSLRHCSPAATDLPSGFPFRDPPQPAPAPPRTRVPLVLSPSTSQRPSPSMPAPPPGLGVAPRYEDIPLAQDVEASAAVAVAAPAAAVAIAAPAAVPAATTIADEEQAWKDAWKAQYVKRLDALADTAWRNHIAGNRR